MRSFTLSRVIARVQFWKVEAHARRVNKETIMKAMRLLGAVFLFLGLSIGHASADGALPPYAPNCNAFGTGISGGAFALQVVNITIQARDINGNPVVVGGETFDVTVAGPALGLPFPVGVTDNGDGTYSAHYFPLLPGTYTVRITLGGTDVNNSPFHPVFTLF